ncbi:hypothetical protein F9C28_17550 [Shimwellia pseudoproteus]|nr:hypothetical protein [Shimwellia pseudoproteus]MBJ3816667.1 hypothetical protein [Shimwellia pseudoproteus]
MTGIDASLVFPLWTAPQPESPPDNMTWCTFGVTGVQVDSPPAYIQGDESVAQWSQETISLTVRFYGPAGLMTATRLRDGMLVTQNHDELNRAGLAFIQQGGILNVPEQINSLWVRRYDTSVDLQHKIIRQYGVKTLVQAPVTFFGE